MALIVDSKLDEIIHFLGGCSSGIIDVHSRIEALQQELGVTRADLLSIITQELNQKVQELQKDNHIQNQRVIELQKGNQESKTELLRSISGIASLLKQVSDYAEGSQSTRVGKLSKEISDAKSAIQSSISDSTKKHEYGLQQANSSLQSVKLEHQSMQSKIIERFNSLERLLDTQQKAIQQQLESVIITVKEINTTPMSCSVVIFLVNAAILVLLIILFRRGH